MTFFWVAQEFCMQAGHTTAIKTVFIAALFYDFLTCVLRRRASGTMIVSYAMLRCGDNGVDAAWRCSFTQPNVMFTRQKHGCRADIKLLCTAMTCDNTTRYGVACNNKTLAARLANRQDATTVNVGLYNTKFNKRLRFGTLYLEFG
jgi:hypothetical protein